ncbi:uncharacterized protein LOC125371785 [Haliotis rufescens]|uniref:uncharacterized protein LOC124126500 n=1 Tax=Haliotis rufescens TaxID=6454 RepID=UPI00201F2557|nr:uncharacterized protein LOC124126500 [Haliotis rufescens]XP_046345902.2 uncharacterized protein LOC124126500 [Haliotis rufescens]XP_048236511.1 uncharacterized protein LOC125371785 [Haliotis rufescens]XP_048236512.1 uncharacterized protein LOC125371785 [Haliotis rufescens]
MKDDHATRSALHAIVVVVFISAAVFGAAFQQGVPGLFLAPFQPEMFRTELTQGTWSAYIFIAVFAWQALWILYSLTLHCRKGPNGSHIDHPYLFSTLFLLVYILGLLLYISWLFLLDREALELAFIVILGSTVCFAICIGRAHLQLYRSRFDLAKQGRRYDDVLFRLFVSNGVSAMFTWSLSHAVNSLSKVIAFRSVSPLGPSTASTIAFSIMILTVVVLSMIDVACNELYTRYTFGSDITRIIIYSAITDNNFGITKVNTIMFILILGITLGIVAIKIALILLRYKTDPVFPSEKYVLEKDTSLCEI